MTKYEIAENLIHSCQIRKSEKYLEEALNELRASQCYEEYFKCYLLYVRVFAELDKRSLIPNIIQTIEAESILFNRPPTPRMYYTRAFCASQLGQFQTAHELCEKSLELSLQEKLNYNDILYSLSGLVACNIAAFKKYDLAI